MEAGGSGRPPRRRVRTVRSGMVEDLYHPQWKNVFQEPKKLSHKINLFNYVFNNDFLLVFLTILPIVTYLLDNYQKKGLKNLLVFLVLRRYN